jgi:hypothetical protein
MYYLVIIRHEYTLALVQKIENGVHIEARVYVGIELVLFKLYQRGMVFYYACLSKSQPL